MMKVLIGTTACIGVLIIGFAFVPCENYNYICPSIDTRYAPGYSEASFSKVVAGMSTGDVEQMLGSPLYVQTNRYGQLQWSYTLDGKCSWGDFAWLVRAVYFTDGHVSEIVTRTAHD